MWYKKSNAKKVNKSNANNAIIILLMQTMQTMQMLMQTRILLKQFITAFAYLLFKTSVIAINFVHLGHWNFHIRTNKGDPIWHHVVKK